MAVLYDGRMRDCYERMKGSHHSSISITHVANKMIKIIWHMLTQAGICTGTETRNSIRKSLRG